MCVARFASVLLFCAFVSNPIFAAIDWSQFPQELEALQASDPWSRLGLEGNEGPSVIKIAYRNLARRYHVDSYSAESLTQVQVDQLNKAFELIHDAYEKISAGKVQGPFRSSPNSSVSSKVKIHSKYYQQYLDEFEREVNLNNGIESFLEQMLRRRPGAKRESPDEYRSARAEFLSKNQTEILNKVARFEDALIVSDITTIWVRPYAERPSDLGESFLKKALHLVSEPAHIFRYFQLTRASRTPIGALDAEGLQMSLRETKQLIQSLAVSQNKSPVEIASEALIAMQTQKLKSQERNWYLDEKRLGEVLFRTLEADSHVWLKTLRAMLKIEGTYELQTPSITWERSLHRFAHSSPNNRAHAIKTFGTQFLSRHMELGLPVSPLERLTSTFLPSEFDAQLKLIRQKDLHERRLQEQFGFDITDKITFLLNHDPAFSDFELNPLETLDITEWVLKLKKRIPELNQLKSLELLKSIALPRLQQLKGSHPIEAPQIQGLSQASQNILNAAFGRPTGLRSQFIGFCKSVIKKLSPRPR